MTKNTRAKAIRESLGVGKILAKEAKKLGIKLLLEPRWGVAGQITTKTGKRRYFRSMAMDLNTQGAARMASDKDYAAFFMKKMGYPIPKGEAFFSDAWSRKIAPGRGIQDAVQYAEKLGYPVIVKPNSKSQGRGVTLVQDSRELVEALQSILRYDRIALVQKPAVGRDYRIVVIDGKVISAYERMPLSVTGDGNSSIRELVEMKQSEFEKSGRDTQIDITDPRISQKLSRQDFSFGSIPAKGQQVNLLDNANLSSGGDAKDVTDDMHKDWQKLSVKIAHDMNLRFTGLDVIVEGDITTVPNKYWILEVNDSPGLDNYAAIGAKQRKIVENLYRKVLLAMAR